MPQGHRSISPKIDEPNNINPHVSLDAKDSWNNTRHPRSYKAIIYKPVSSTERLSYI